MIYSDFFRDINPAVIFLLLKKDSVWTNSHYFLFFILYFAYAKQKASFLLLVYWLCPQILLNKD